LELGQVPAFGLGMPYEGQSESDEPIVVSKFLPDEFQSFQSNLTRLYYLISVDSNESPGLSNRVVFGHRFGCRVDTEHVRNPYESGFIYMDSFSKLYMRRIPEFSALFETRYFYLRVPSRFVPRAAWVPSSELPLPVSDSLVKLVNAQMSSIWDSNCLSTVNSWRSRSIDYPTRRSFGNSPNFFDSKFNVNLNDWSQVKLYALVDHSNRNSHIGISMYFQLQYDIYWIFRSNTNIFTMYAFRPDFHFSDISFKFPHWLLGNLSPNLVNSIAYQDDIGSLYTHVLLLQVNIGDCFAASGIFYEALARLAKSGHRHYDQYLFNHLDSESLIHTSDLKVFRVIDRERSQSQGKVSEGVSDWADNLIFESVARDRAMINQMVVDYLAKELEIIPKSAMGDFQSLRVNYLYQSLYSTYLHARTEISFKRFVLKGEAKLGNFASDVMAMVRNLMFVYTADDRLLDREPESKKHIAVFEQLYLQRQKFVEYLKAIFRVFPSSRFIGIDSILGVFIAGAYVYTDYTTWPLNMRTLLNVRHKILHPRESDELWNFFMDCGVFIIYWIITWL
jgi:hypothetical protein